MMLGNLSICKSDNEIPFDEGGPVDESAESSIFVLFSIPVKQIGDPFIRTFLNDGILSSSLNFTKKLMKTSEP